MYFQFKLHLNKSMKLSPTLQNYRYWSSKLEIILHEDLHISLYHNNSSCRQFYALTMLIYIYTLFTKNWFIYEVLGTCMLVFYLTSVSYLSYLCCIRDTSVSWCNSPIFFEYPLMFCVIDIQHKNIYLKPFYTTNQQTFVSIKISALTVNMS